MSEQRKRDEDKPLADRRAEADAPQEVDHDFGDERTPGPTDPPVAEDDAPGGEDDGYSSQTEIPSGSEIPRGIRKAPR